MDTKPLTLEVVQEYAQIIAKTANQVEISSGVLFIPAPNNVLQIAEKIADVIEKGIEQANSIS